VLVACRHAPAPPAAVPRVVDGEGLRAELAAHRGHPLVVNFWATWCGPCVDEFPDLVASARAWRARGVHFLSVSADDPKDLPAVRRMLERFGAPFDAVVVVSGDADAVISKMDPAWGGALPSTFVFDAGGRQVDKRLGGVVDQKKLNGWLAPLAASP